MFLFKKNEKVRASVIAYYYVLRGIEEGNPITQMRLQRLLYYSQGFYLATYNEPLFIDEFKVYSFGVHIPIINKDYVLYGNEHITDFKTFMGDKVSIIKKVLKLDSKSVEILDTTWKTLYNFSSIELGAFITNDKSPWKKLLDRSALDAVIPIDDIKEQFKQFVK